jgi:hypothetical protein
MLIVLQPETVVDAVAADGTKLYRTPYPFVVAPNGGVEGQEFWRGDPKGVVGFQRAADVQHVDLWWDDYAAGDPQDAVGMFPVMTRARGSLYTFTIAIESVTVLDGVLPVDSGHRCYCQSLQLPHVHTLADHQEV